MKSKENFPKVYLYKRIVQAKLFIDVHFAEEIDLEKISDEACFSKFHFIRLFKSIYRKTPHQYLMEVRIENAKLLLAKEMAISNVCFSVGFDSVTSFTTLFKRYEGITPSVYRERQTKRNADVQSNPMNYIPNCFAENFGWVKTSFSNFQ